VDEFKPMAVGLSELSAGNIRRAHQLAGRGLHSFTSQLNLSAL
jgi:hypothetical protein